MMKGKVSSTSRPFLTSNEKKKEQTETNLFSTREAFLVLSHQRAVFMSVPHNTSKDTTTQRMRDDDKANKDEVEDKTRRRQTRQTKQDKDNDKEN